MGRGHDSTDFGELDSTERVEVRPRLQFSRANARIRWRTHRLLASLRILNMRTLCGKVAPACCRTAHAMCDTRSPVARSFQMWTRLTPGQAEAFKCRVQPMLRFLHSCRRRLDTRGFDPKSPLYTAVAKAYDAMHGLHVELHYLSVRRGVGKPQEESEEEGKKGRE
jgi:hypothetical protein